MCPRVRLIEARSGPSPRIRATALEVSGGSAMFDISKVWLNWLAFFTLACLQPWLSSDPAETQPNAAEIVIDYPENGSIFPPEITPSTFLWRDCPGWTTSWRGHTSLR